MLADTARPWVQAQGWLTAPAGSPGSTTWQRSYVGGAPGLALLVKLGETWALTGLRALVDIARDLQQPDGSFGTDGTPNAEFIVPALAEAALLARGVVPDAEVDEWVALAAGGAEYLWGTFPYYVNGNIELAKVLDYHLLWRLTGDGKWAARRDQQYDFTINPPQSGQSAGFGLTITQQPAAADGSDGAGWIAESGGSTPGLDWYYSVLQLEFLTTWWNWSQDPRALRLVNLIENQLTQRLNRTTWQLDATGGTRRSITAPYLSPSRALLVWGGHRPDLAPLDPFSQWPTIETTYRTQTPTETLYRGWGDILTSWRLQAQAQLG